MCGIVGAIATRENESSASNILPLLLDGLKRLEYRGYDSAGVALLDDAQKLQRTRSVGRIAKLEQKLAEASPCVGNIGIAHTRWATHGPPTEANAHPHIRDDLALVCNGIIENYEQLRAAQLADGFSFTSQTDTEVVVNEISRYLEAGMDLRAAVQKCQKSLEGAYALCVLSAKDPRRLIGVRCGSSLVVGLGQDAAPSDAIGITAAIASDMNALLSVTHDFLILEEGDLVDIQEEKIAVIGSNGKAQKREPYRCPLSADVNELGEYRHYMRKEIGEQGVAIAGALEGRISDTRLLEECFGAGAGEVFDRVRAVQIIACGTSYHAGLVAQYWFEQYGVPCRVEIASEFRSRAHAGRDVADCLVVALSQSGETIDTLAALDEAKRQGFGASLAICNSPESSLVRAARLVLMTRAGVELSVASTKAFTTQLCMLLLLVIALGRRFDMSAEDEARLIGELHSLPGKVEEVIALEGEIAAIAEKFVDRQHALFLGRGAHYPVALEGALKLKEISYIHAEGYPAGELKHGPLALVDSDMPVVAVAPNDALLKKLKSNFEEVRARRAKLVVFADSATEMRAEDNLQVVTIAPIGSDSAIAPIVYTIPLQLLAYHVALNKGTDVDKPRNLAKSVTVE